MDLNVTQVQTTVGTRRTLHLKTMARRQDVDIFFDLIGTQAPVPTILDGFVFGIIMFAMGIGEDIRVHGPVSFDGLANMNEFQEAWVLWKPKVYRKVAIIPDEIIECLPKATPASALAAFSGGVDSLFTVLRHNRRQLGHASYPLREAVLMVHGFDVPLAAKAQFEKLKQRTMPLLDSLNLSLLNIRTNIKELGIQNWEDSFIPQLACCMHNYSHMFCYALVGSSEPYNALVLPWGSNPATDHLLSSETMRLIHDGAGYSRTDKVEYLAKNELATQVVKVCWEGVDTSKNCGECEKCIRTKLNFMAVGVANPSCFDSGFSSDGVETMELNNEAQLGELKSILQYARDHNADVGWTTVLETRIRGYRPPKGKARRIIMLIRRGKWSKIGAALKRRFLRRWNWPAEV